MSAAEKLYRHSSWQLLARPKRLLRRNPLRVRQRISEDLAPLSMMSTELVQRVMGLISSAEAKILMLDQASQSMRRWARSRHCLNILPFACVTIASEMGKSLPIESIDEQNISRSLTRRHSTFLANSPSPVLKYFSASFTRRQGWKISSTILMPRELECSICRWLSSSPTRYLAMRANLSLTLRVLSMWKIRYSSLSTSETGHFDPSFTASTPTISCSAFRMTALTSFPSSSRTFRHANTTSSCAFSITKNRRWVGSTLLAQNSLREEQRAICSSLKGMSFLRVREKGSWLLSSRNHLLILPRWKSDQLWMQSDFAAWSCIEMNTASARSVTPDADSRHSRIRSCSSVHSAFIQNPTFSDTCSLDSGYFYPSPVSFSSSFSSCEMVTEWSQKGTMKCSGGFSERLSAESSMLRWLQLAGMKAELSQRGDSKLYSSSIARNKYKIFWKPRHQQRHSPTDKGRIVGRYIIHSLLGPTWPARDA